MMRKFLSFSKNNNGIFLILTALSALPMSIMVTGAVDVVNVATAKSQVIHAVNLGLLSAKPILEGRSTYTQGVEDIINANILGTSSSTTESSSPGNSGRATSRGNGNGGKATGTGSGGGTTTSSSNSLKGVLEDLRITTVWGDGSVTLNIEADLKKNLTTQLIRLMMPGYRTDSQSTGSTNTGSSEAPSLGGSSPSDGGSTSGGQLDQGGSSGSTSGSGLPGTNPQTNGSSQAPGRATTGTSASPSSQTSSTTQNSNTSELMTIRYTTSAALKYPPIDLVFVVDALRFVDGQGRVQSPASILQILLAQPSNKISKKIKEMADKGTSIRIGFVPYTTTVNAGYFLTNSMIQGGRGSLHSSLYACLGEWWDGQDISAMAPFPAYRSYLYGNDWPPQIPSFTYPQLSGEWGHHNCSRSMISFLSRDYVTHPMNVAFDIPVTQTSNQPGIGQSARSRVGWGAPLPHVGLLWAWRMLFNNSIWSVPGLAQPTSNTKTVMVLLSGAPTGVQFPLQDAPEWDTGIQRMWIAGNSIKYGSFTNLDAYSAYGYLTDPRELEKAILMMQGGGYNLRVQNPALLGYYQMQAQASREMQLRFGQVCNQLRTKAKSQDNLGLYSIGFTSLQQDPNISVQGHFNAVRACNSDSSFASQAIIDSSAQNLTNALESKLTEVISKLQGVSTVSIS